MTSAAQRPPYLVAAGEAEPAERQRWVQSTFPPQLGAVRAARSLVEGACRAWHLDDMREDAALIISELAANAVEHGRTDLTATVFDDGCRLHLAVHDRNPRYPFFEEPAPARSGRLDERGRGLRLVRAVASAWGALPALDGKVVWATLACTPGDQETVRAGSGRGHSAGR